LGTVYEIWVWGFGDIGNEKIGAPAGGCSSSPAALAAITSMHFTVD
jgi:hypothetical protein